jgi:transaldolase
MKLYIDSAVHSEWKLPPGCPAPQGVTTNPTLVLRAGLPVSLPSYLRLLAQAGDYGLPELMLQLPYADVRQGLVWLDALQAAAARAGVHLTIKLPCHADWEPLLRAVRARDVPVLLTGVANPVQLLWATQMGAAYVAPYLGRLEAAGRDVWALVAACVAVQAQGTGLLAASVKTPDVLTKLIAAGAAAATLQPALIASLATDSITADAMRQFDKDALTSQALPLPAAP